MKTGIVAIFAVFMFFAASTGFADHAITCGTNVITYGDLKSSVLRKCGKPYLKEDIGGNGTRERWTYNFGSSDFMKILTFDGDRLESIEEGDKGFDK